MQHNFSRTFMLMAAMCALFMVCGWMVGGTAGMMIALAIAAAMNFFTYWNADTLVLRMYRAQPVSKDSDFYKLVAKLVQNAGLPMPKVCIMDNPQPNAFATGRNPENAAVCATSGLLKALNSHEVAAVMAHELAHVQNRDSLTMTMTATLAGAIGMLGNLAMLTGRGRNGQGQGTGAIGSLLLMFVAPLAASLVQMAVSRSREYGADARGAEICGNPEALASALAKIDKIARGVPNPTAEDAPATANLFIINPLRSMGFNGLFTTHPSTQDRIDRLMAMARTMPAAEEEKQTGTGGPWG